MSLIDRAYAVKIEDIWKFSDKNPNFASLGALVSFFLPKVLLVGGIIFFILIIVAGFQMLFNAGSEDAHTLEKWHQILIYGIIGLVIMLTAIGVLQILNFITFDSFKGIF